MEQLRGLDAYLTREPPAACSAVDEVDCETCDGSGWYEGHAATCDPSQDCQCGGVQVQCSDCKGTGKVSLQCGNEATRCGLCSDHLAAAAEDKADRDLHAMRDEGVA